MNNELLVQYKLDASPTPSDEEDMSSDEEDAFGPKKEKVEEDPVKSKIFKKKTVCLLQDVLNKIGLLIKTY